MRGYLTEGEAIGEPEVIARHALETFRAGLSGVGAASAAASVPGLIAVSNYTDGSVTALRTDGSVLYSVQIGGSPSRVAVVR